MRTHQQEQRCCRAGSQSAATVPATPSFCFACTRFSYSACPWGCVARIAASGARDVARPVRPRGGDWLPGWSPPSLMFTVCAPASVPPSAAAILGAHAARLLRLMVQCAVTRLYGNNIICAMSSIPTAAEFNGLREVRLRHFPWTWHRRTWCESASSSCPRSVESLAPCCVQHQTPRARTERAQAPCVCL
jgi:hypothetical protein